jgi:putative serine protease PepD
VIGLATTAGTSSSSPASTFVTPIDVAQSVASDIITTGHAMHTWLGVQGTDLSEDAATALGVDGGALVRTVTAHSPAATVALMVGDVIVAVGTTEIRSMSALVVALRAHHPGDRVSLTYYRDQSRRAVSVTLVDRPDK